MTRFKICGLRQVDHALTAADAGADFLGFNFVPGVRRQLSEDRARTIIQEFRRSRGSGGPRLVGLFADQPLEDVNRIIRYCALDMAQLCGDEPPEFWAQVEVPVIRQIKVRDDGPKEETTAQLIDLLDAVVALGHIPLLDRHEVGSLGGTGRTFDWRIARQLAKRHDVLLAGGLHPENVAQAIATVRPWGVDVSSGVETGGTKDPKKIAAFAERVRQATGPTS